MAKLDAAQQAYLAMAANLPPMSQLLQAVNASSGGDHLGQVKAALTAGSGQSKRPRLEDVLVVGESPNGALGGVNCFECGPCCHEGSGSGRNAASAA